KQLKPTEFEDIIAMVSLYRPGPMDFIPSYIARKHGQEKIKYLHPKLEPILKNTYGIAVYQEQVLQMARDLAGYTLGEADVLRKAVGKKIKELLDAQKEKFVQGCIKNKIDKKIAEKLFAFIEPFARYGFNRAHASCYAMIGFRTAYLKAHYPAEFMSALLTADQENTDRVAIEVDECRAMGIKVLPPDINESEENFVVTNPKTIRFGLNAIKNVGHNIVSAIVYERQKNNKYKTLENLLQRVTHKDLNKKSLESLIKCGALSQFGERNRLLANLETILNFARSLQKSANSNQVSLFGASDIAAPQLRLEDTKPVPKRQQLIWEKELLGLYISANPLEGFRDYLSAHTISCKDLENSALNQPIRIGGIIHRAKKYITKTGKPMMFVEIEDLTGKSEVVVFPRTLEQNPNIWQEDKILMIAGKLNERNGARSFICESARELG
ncbi:DNA polymerase III subunit alpha, partial [bacterium]|nr:DNA polymerase III subunit alpha [bacterium]